MLIRLGILEEQAGVTADTIQYLVIAGGGGGGCDDGGGGGAGGYRSSVTGESSGGGASAESSLLVTANTNYTVTVGAGGTGSTSYSNSGNKGSNSVFGSITSEGGGGGKSRNSGTSFSTGGSGGGGSYSTTGNTGGGLGTANQGFNGGNGNSTVNSGGGGGAGAIGGNSTTANGGGGVGGIGIASSITGTSVTRAGGGGGGNAGAGGAGGGGTGSSVYPSPKGGNATANTGGGGGGQGNSPTLDGGNGGSGIVIIRYPAKYALQIDGGLTYSHATVGTDRVTTFTAGTGNIQFIDSTNTYELIESVILTSSQASVTFSNLGNYSGTYKHLQFRVVASGTIEASQHIRFNGDTGANYSWHGLQGNGSTVSSFAYSGASYPYIAFGRLSSSTTNFSASVVDILDAFSTTKNKTVRSLTGLQGSWVRLQSGGWYSTSALSSVNFYLESGSMIAGTRISMYGVK